MFASVWYDVYFRNKRVIRGLIGVLCRLLFGTLSWPELVFPGKFFVMVQIFKYCVVCLPLPDRGCQGAGPWCCGCSLMVLPVLWLLGASSVVGDMYCRGAVLFYCMQVSVSCVVMSTTTALGHHTSQYVQHGTINCLLISLVVGTIQRRFLRYMYVHPPLVDVVGYSLW